MQSSPRQPEAVLQRLEWTVIRRLDGLLQGNYHTLFRGFGMDLRDLREYQAEDDSRWIDWNVTARTGVPHVRVYNEDRDMTAWFLLDLSPSVDTGSVNISKRQMLTEFTVVLAQLLARGGSKVGAILHDGAADFIVQPGSSRQHLLQLVQRVLSHPGLSHSQPTDLGAFIGRASLALKRRSLVFVVSDFISKPGWERPLSALNRRHEGVGVRLVDPLDDAIPDVGLLMLQDAESGEQLLVDTADKRFQRRLAEVTARRDETVMKAIADARMDFLELSTGDDLVEAILRYVDLRKARLRLGYGHAMPAHLMSAP